MTSGPPRLPRRAMPRPFEGGNRVPRGRIWRGPIWNSTESRRRDRARCWRRTPRSPHRSWHRRRVPARRWRESAGIAARTGLAAPGRWPAAPRNCPGRQAARRGVPATPTRSRRRSPVQCCRPRPGPAGPPLFLRDAPDTPARLGCCPVAQACPGIVSGPPVPGHPVAENMIRRLGHSSQRLSQPTTSSTRFPHGSQRPVRGRCGRSRLQRSCIVMRAGSADVRPIVMAMPRAVRLLRHGEPPVGRAQPPLFVPCRW
jgi:hypothetical protein